MFFGPCRTQGEQQSTCLHQSRRAPPGHLNLTCGLLAVRPNLHQSINRFTHSQAARTHSVILPGRFSKRSYVAAAHRTVAMCFCFCAQLSHRKGSHAVNVCGRSAFFFLFFFFNSRMWRANSEIEQYENQSPLESRRGAGFDTGGCEVPWVRGRVGS